MPRSRTTRSPSNADPNARRIIAYGLRNPFRFSVRPGTDEIWIGDVGWNDWEEINRIADANDSVVENFGWPCYEGNPRAVRVRRRQPQHLREPVRAAERDHERRTSPTTTATRWSPASPARPAARPSSGLAFAWYASGPYPAAYEGALFFADYSRNCIWVMKKDGERRSGARPDRDVRRRRRRPGRPPDRARRESSSTRTSTAARSIGSGTTRRRRRQDDKALNRWRRRRASMRRGMRRRRRTMGARRLGGARRTRTISGGRSIWGRFVRWTRCG